MTRLFMKQLWSWVFTKGQISSWGYSAFSTVTQIVSKNLHIICRSHLLCSINKLPNLLYKKLCRYVDFFVVDIITYYGSFMIWHHISVWTVTKMIKKMSFNINQNHIKWSIILATKESTYYYLSFLLPPTIISHKTIAPLVLNFTAYPRP